MREVWRPVVGYETHYAVSNLGRIKRTKRCGRYHAGRMLAPLKGTNDYLYLNLCDSGERKRLPIHHLVALAFIGPRPLKHEINHKDFNRANNFYKNLEWVTKSRNLQHCIDAGRKPSPSLTHPETIIRGEKHPWSTITLKQARQIKELIALGYSTLIISEATGIKKTTIYNIRYGKNWRSA